MARYDDGKRGFAVSDALGLGEAWQQYQKMLDSGALKFEVTEIPPGMLEYFFAEYPPDQRDRALYSQLQTDQAERTLIDAIQSGSLPLWVTRAKGPVAERQVAATSLLDFGRESLIAGCYRPYGDTENLVFGYPLFVKVVDWVKFTASFSHVQETIEPSMKKGTQARRKPGPASDPDWPAAIAKVTDACRDAGYRRLLRRGEKAAIIKMLLDAMAEKDKHPSDDTARRYAADVIARLPDNYAE